MLLGAAQPGIDSSKVLLVSALVEGFVKKSGVSKDRRDELQHQFVSLAVTLLGSSIGASSSAVDEGIALQQVRASLERRNAHSHSLRASELHEQLKQKSGLDSRSRSALLQLLLKLSAASTTAASGIGGLVFLANGPSTRPAKESAAAIRERLYGGTDGGVTVGGRRTSLTNPAPHSNASTYLDREPKLVRGMLYACQGIDSPGLFTFEASLEEEFVMRNRDSMTLTQRTICAQLAEVGIMYRKVLSAARDTAPYHGAVRQALAAALGAELNDYHRLLAVLDSHAATPVPLPGMDGPVDGSFLTLKRLRCFMSKALRHMRVCAVLADCSAGVRGGGLVGAIHALSQHGDTFVSSLTQRVLQQVCVPLFQMIQRWVFEGALHDPYGEFFVVSNAKLEEDPNLDLWRDGYHIDRQRCPPFLNTQLAESILRAGKSIHFLRRCCSDAQWVEERAMAAQATSSSLNYGQVAALEKVVNDACAAVDKRLMQVLLGRFQFGKHCDALRRYLLLAQGDFVEALLDLAQDELNKDAVALSEVTANHLVRGAVLASCARYDEDEVLDRLRAKKDRYFSSGDVGWDVFLLQYEVRMPLGVVFTDVAMRSYQQAFQLLWRLRRVDHALAACWQGIKSGVERTMPRLRRALPTLEGADEVEVLLRRCLLLRSEMGHFVTNFQYYIMFEVLEVAWKGLQASCESASNLDALIEGHDRYLAEICRKSMLDPQSEEVCGVLYSLLNNMLGLHGTVKAFTQAVAVVETAVMARAQHVSQRTAGGGWGTAASDDPAFSLPELAELSDNLDKLEREHHRLLSYLTAMLPAQAHLEVRFLLCRLNNFSDFYKMRHGSMEL